MPAPKAGAADGGLCWREMSGTISPPNEYPGERRPNKIDEEMPAAARLKIPGAFFPDLNIEPLDLLVQSGKRNVEAFRGISLVPVAFLQHSDDQAAFAILNNFK